MTTGSPDLTLLRFFSVAVLVASILLTAWDKFLWKLAPVQRTPRVPRDVNGTWEARLESFWVNPETGTRIPPKTVYVVIRQTSSAVSVTLLSNESRSKSSIARLVQEDGSWTLHYIYTNEPGYSVVTRSPIHHGSGVLRVIGQPATRINGDYWTDRDSKGHLHLNHRVKAMAEDYAGAVQLFEEVAA